MTEGEVVERLQKPWGLKRLLMGKWPNRAKERRQSEYEDRLYAALRFIIFLEHSKMPPEEMVALLLELREKAHQHKRDENGINSLSLR
jgi:hypothetical protein